MPTGTEPVSTATLIMSSAVVSAGVNVGWNAIAKLMERRKEHKAEVQRIGHVYLALTHQLEAFARRCNGRLYDISVARDRYCRMHDQKAYDGFEHFVFEFMPEPDWTALPIPFVAEVKALPNRFEQCNSWINSQFHQWADMDEAYELDAERLAYYALKSCELASKIRVKLKADDDQLDDLVTHFRHIIDKRRERYKNNPDFYVLIPELRAQFDNE